MSSIFNFSGFQSPPKRPLIIPSPTSPFCTSPSQLQEVTLDQEFTFSNSMGLGSPSGTTRGRSIKEFEEQLSTLKKENFNLKLRIYFLEEGMGSNFNLDKENVVKKNVELRVEVESLRKELQEKHDLLCQAVKAMELEEEEHKKTADEKEKIILEFQQENECLKTQISEVRCCSVSPRDAPSCDVAIQENQLSTTVIELQDKIETLEEELRQEKGNFMAIQLLIDQKDSNIRSLLSELDEANSKIVVLERNVDEMNRHLDEAKTKLSRKTYDSTKMLDDVVTENGALQQKYSSLKLELSREHKRYEKLKCASDQKVFELQAQLEASMEELKKIPQPAAPARPAQKNAHAAAPLPAPPVLASSAPPTSSPQPSSPTSSMPSPASHSSANSNSCTAAEIDQLLKDGSTDPRQLLHQFAQKIVKLKADQMKACKIIKCMIESRNQSNREINQLKAKNEQLEQELESVVSVSGPSAAVAANHAVSRQSGDNPNSPRSPSIEMEAELVERYRALTNELEEKNRILEATLQQKDTQLRLMIEQCDEFHKELKQKDDRVVDLEFELLSLDHQDKSNTSLNSGGNATGSFSKLLEEKDAQIERLNDNLTKRNCDLQGLVNNELWRKNREIEKLEKRYASEILKLNSELSTKDMQLKVIKEKISETGMVSEEGSEKRTADDLELELERSERLRKEASDMCAVLSERLTELAVFLDWLLKQRSVLGFLGGKENRRLRQLIDQSLDLSRSFTMSMMVSQADQSLAQLSNISSLLGNNTYGEDIVDVGDNETSKVDDSLSLVPANATLTYRSHLCKKTADSTSGNSVGNSNADVTNPAGASLKSNSVVETLREQIVNLKYELQLRDVELNKLNNGEGLNTTTTTLKYKSDNQSESEAWSEPDRNVSRARIGLEEATLSSSKKSASSDSTADQQHSRNSRTPSKKYSSAAIMDLQRQVVDLDENLRAKETQLDTERLANSKLRQQLTNCELKLADAETKLAASETQRDEALAALSELGAAIKQLEADKAELIELDEAKDEDMRSRMEEIEAEKAEAIGVAKRAQEVAEMAKSEIKVSEAKLRAMQKEVANVRAQVQAEAEEHIATVTAQAEEEIKALQDTIQEIRLHCSTNCVKKSDVAASEAQVRELSRRLEASQRDYAGLVDTCKEVQSKLATAQDKVNELRHELDTATSQYSEAVLEKARIANERALLKQELNLNSTKEVELRKQFEDIQADMANIRQNYQKQVSNLQQTKSRLEVRVSELESANAELHNRLIKIQAGYGEQLYSSSLPNSPHSYIPANFQSDGRYRRQMSDTSEEHHHHANDRREVASRSFVIGRSRDGQGLDVERHEANSSPDLGIESDHGRFSSLETQLNVPRPLLQTLELTESMSNLLDGENNQVQSADGDSDHCCQKSLEMAQENSDLKRKLLRTRRALEETVTQLTLANQRKKQVEKTICKQIHKTSQVLRKAKANLDSGSETDGLNKTNNPC